MPGPVGPLQSLIRPDLRNAVIEVWNTEEEAQTFIADQVAKRVDVDFASGTAVRIPREAMTKDTANVDRGPNGTYQEVEYITNTLQYATKEQALAMRIDQKLSNQVRTYFDAELYAGKILMSKLKRAHEKLVATTTMSTALFSNNAASANWRTSSSSATPVQDFLAARYLVRKQCGKDPNTVVLDWYAFQVLRETSQMLGRISGGARDDHVASVAAAEIAKVIEIPNIVIAKGIADTSRMGQTFVGSELWDFTKVWVGWVPPGSPDVRDPCPITAWNYEGDGGSWDWTFETYFDNDIRANKVRGRRDVGVGTPYAEFGTLITGVNS